MSEESASGDEHAESHATLDALTYVLICLVIGCFTRSALKKVPLPYTVLLLVWGIWIGVGQATYGVDLPYLSGGVVAWENVNPEFFLALFLPVLLFASAFAIEWYTLRQVWWQAFMLAFPGVVLGTGITAVLVHYVFPYNWTWPQCLMFGSMMSATDPVAVVALLKEVGVDKRVRVVVDAEALLNDGSAFVLFLIFEEFVRGNHLSPAECFGMLAKLSLGGPLFGLAIGLAVVVWLRFVYNDFLLEITLTIAAAYAAFIVGNVMLGVSGVLALVALGLFMSAAGGSHISKQVMHSLHVVWEQLEFMANTVIFVLSGTIIAARILEAHQDNGITHIMPRDYGYAALLWLMLLGVRAVIFIMLFPVLKVTGYGITISQVIVYVWAGLRGAVGLSLALFVLFDPTLGDYDMRVLMFFLLGFVAMMSILVQGSTCGLLLQVLGMSKTPLESRLFYENVLQHVEEEGERRMEGHREDPLLGEPRWDLIDVMCQLDYGSIMALQSNLVSRRVASAVEGTVGSFRATSRTGTGSSPGTKYENFGAENRLALRLNRTHLVQETRSRFLNVVRSVYQETFDRGLLGTTQLYRLLGNVDRSLDMVHRPLSDWRLMEPNMALRNWTKWLARLMGPGAFPGSQRVFAFFLGFDVRGACQMAVAVLAAHTEAQELLKDRDTWFADRSGDASGMFYDQGLDQLMKDARANVVDQVVAESRAICDAVRKYIEDAGVAFPQVLMDVRTHQVSADLLHHKRSYINKLRRSGLLDEKEHEELSTLVDKRIKVLELGGPATSLQRSADLLPDHPLTGPLRGAPLDRLLKHCKLRVYNAGEDVTPEPGYCLLIASGHMAIDPTGEAASEAEALQQQGRMAGPPQPPKGRQVAERGSVLGLDRVLGCPGGLVSGGKGAGGAISAASMAVVLLLPVQELQHALQGSGDASEVAWQYLAAQQAALLPPAAAGWRGGMTYTQLLWLFLGARVKSIPEGGTWTARQPSFLADGSLDGGNGGGGGDGGGGGGGEGGKLQAPAYVDGDDAAYTALSACKLLLLPANYGETAAAHPAAMPGADPGGEQAAESMAARQQAVRRAIPREPGDEGALLL